MKRAQSIIEQAWQQSKYEVPEAFQTLDMRTNEGKHLLRAVRQEFLFFVEELAIEWFDQKMRVYQKERR